MLTPAHGRRATLVHSCDMNLFAVVDHPKTGPTLRVVPGKTLPCSHIGKHGGKIIVAPTNQPIGSIRACQSGRRGFRLVDMVGTVSRLKLSSHSHRQQQPNQVGECVYHDKISFNNQLGKQIYRQHGYINKIKMYQRQASSNQMEVVWYGWKLGKIDRFSFTFSKRLKHLIRQVHLIDCPGLLKQMRISLNLKLETQRQLPIRNGRVTSCRAAVFLRLLVVYQANSL